MINGTVYTLQQTVDTCEQTGGELMSLNYLKVACLDVLTITYGGVTKYLLFSRISRFLETFLCYIL